MLGRDKRRQGPQQIGKRGNWENFLYIFGNALGEKLGCGRVGELFISFFFEVCGKLFGDIQKTF